MSRIMHFGKRGKVRTSPGTTFQVETTDQPHLLFSFPLDHHKPDLPLTIEYWLHNEEPAEGQLPDARLQIEYAPTNGDEAPYLIFTMEEGGSRGSHILMKVENVDGQSPFSQLEELGNKATDTVVFVGTSPEGSAVALTLTQVAKEDNEIRYVLEIT